MAVEHFLALAIGSLLLLWGFALLRRRLREGRRGRLRQQPLSAEQIRILDRNVPLYARLPEALKRDLHANVQIFLREKIFLGRGGLEVTEEMKLTVAGNACLLLLNRANDCFPGFRTILLYPDTYAVPEEEQDGDVVHQVTHSRAGESWYRGPVILSWADVLFSTQGEDAAFNVVLHEFAHKLDEENGWTDGNPVRGAAAREWAEVFSRAYEEFLAAEEADPDSVIDEYAATAPEEFFAVCTESFFGKPHQLQRDWPELYRQLAGFYAVDPAQWSPRPALPD